MVQAIFFISVEHQMLEDNLVTIRYRDDMKQERISITETVNVLNDKTDVRKLLRTLTIFEKNWNNAH